MKEHEIINAMNNPLPDQVVAVINDCINVLETTKIKYMVRGGDYNKYLVGTTVPTTKGGIPGPNRNFHRNNKTKANNYSKRRLSSCSKSQLIKS